MSVASHRGGNDQKLSDMPVGLAPAAQSGQEPAHRGQAEPRRVNGVYPHEDWPRIMPHFDESVGGDGFPVFRQY